jgi:DNA-binding NarL/FixJ family response regulator
MIHVLIVESQCLNGTLMASLLQKQPDVHVIGHVPDVSGALQQAEQCDVVLVSAELPDGGALELTRALRTARPKLLITGLIDSPALILSYVEAGAAGYVLRDGTSDELIRNVQAVYAGQVYLPGSIVTLLVERMRELLAMTQRLDQEAVKGGPLRVELTERERAVLALLAQGLTNQEIAEVLVIGAGTAKNHVHNILKKLSVSSRVAAARYFLFTAADHALSARRPIEGPPLTAAAGQ